MCQRWFFVVAALWGLAGCSPWLNWREVEGIEGARWWFPCKPDRVERVVTLADRSAPARMAVCDAQGASWSVMALQFPGPAEAAQALAPARMTLMMNLQGAEVPMPANLGVSDAGLQWLRGQRAGGEAVVAAMQFRVEGRWLVQRVLLVNQAQWPQTLHAEALETFFAGAMPR